MTIEPFENEKLRIDVEPRDDVVYLNWVGKSESREPGVMLTPYLTKLARELVGKTVVVDFQRLEYMNSNTVMPIVQFIKELDANKISAKLLYNSSLSWQRMSFETLKTVAQLLSHVTIEGRA